MTTGTDTRQNPKLDVMVARSRADVEATMRLRYHVFAEELGANIHHGGPGLESDHYDELCDHMLVRERATGRVIACSRILDGERARAAVGFYSASEFEMDAVATLPGRIMELGRTCVHPEHRTGATISTLWSGLARYIVERGYDYLIGCASIPVDDGGAQARAIMNRLRTRYMAPAALTVRPKLSLPSVGTGRQVLPKLPPLLKAYLSLGARVCGEPCWDPDFGVADVFILVDTQRLSARYVRHFLGQDATAIPRAASA